MILRAFATLTILAVGLAGSAPVRAELSDAELRREIEAFALGYAGPPPFAMEIPALEDFTAPSAGYGHVDVHLSTRAQGPVRGSLPVTVRLRADGEEFKRGIVTVRLRSDHPALVAARDLPVGHVLAEADLRREPVSRHEASRGVTVDASQLVGRRVRRFVRVGTVLRPEIVEDVPVIRRGSTVRLRLQRGPLRIEAVGRARENAAAGQPVRVLNLESRREVVGIVRPDGVVHVQF